MYKKTYKASLNVKTRSSDIIFKHIYEDLSNGGESYRYR